MSLVVTLPGVLNSHRVRRPKRHNQVRWVVWVRDFWPADDTLGQAGVVRGDQSFHVPAEVVC